LRSWNSLCIGLMIAVASALTPVARAQLDGTPITIGTYHSLRSSVLGETRRLLISTPPEYDVNRHDRYPVVYLLDGPFNFNHTVGLLRFKASVGACPSMIVVGVANTNRTHDMTPAGSDARSRGGGGAEDFLRFFTDELIPTIDRQFRTTSHRTLIGHSLGGLFALHAFVTSPDTFDAIIAISPSLWWNDGATIEAMSALLDERTTFDHTIYMTLGDEPGPMQHSFEQLEALLDDRAHEGLRWASRVMDDETHMSVVYRGTHDGMAFVCTEWPVRNVVAIYDEGGILAVHDRCKQAGARFGLLRRTPREIIDQLSTDLIRAQRFEDAISVLEHDPEMYPPTAAMYALLGRAFERAGDNQRAVEAFTSALERDRAYEPARVGLRRLGTDPERDIGTVDVPRRLLRAYAGQYFTPDVPAPLKVFYRGDALHLEHPYQGTHQMTPVSMTRFTTMGGAVTLEFERDERTRRSTAVTVTSAEGSTRAMRMRGQ